MRRTIIATTAAAAVLCLAPLSATQAASSPPTPGAAGIGDPYFPLDGNGGYDVGHYDLDLRYDPATDALTRPRHDRARRATQNLSRFNLDLEGLTSGIVRVERRAAPRGRAPTTSSTVTPTARAARQPTFTVSRRATTACRRCSTTALGVGLHRHRRRRRHRGQPHVAATLVPRQRPPARQGDVHVPRHGPARARGRRQRRPRSKRTARAAGRPGRGRPRPDGTYLATATIGQFDLQAYREDGHRVPGRDRPGPVRRRSPRRDRRRSSPSPRRPDSSYKRLAAPSACPPAGRSCRSGSPATPSPTGTSSFVEAHPVGTTTGRRCPTSTATPTRAPATRCPLLAGPPSVPRALPDVDDGDGTCAPTGTTGAVVRGHGQQRRLRAVGGRPVAYAGQTVEISLSYASDDIVQLSGVYVDDVVVSTGEGTTSFEDDGDPLDGWTVRARRPAARATRTTGSSRRPPTCRRHGRGRRRPRSRVSRRSSTSSPATSAATRSRRRRHRRRRRGARLRPGDPDPADLLARASSPTPSRATPSSSTSSPTSGPATASPSQRWQRHLAQRGLRDVRRVAVAEREGLGTAQEIFDFFYDDSSPPTTRSGGAHHRRPRAGPALRRPGLLPRRDDPAGPAPDRSATAPSSGS